MPRGDHPRSRGVYSPPPSRRGGSSGSSPLARGLRRLRQRRVQPPGIIPARAGFTADAATTPPSPTDHPRSRGVYTGRITAEHTVVGSSPLARGLRSGRRSATPTRRDHPRSRGVYPGPCTMGPGWPGSSPLARGLHTVLTRDRTGAGIIPARAGFTHGGRQGRAAHGDHPRSRGVYWTPPPARPTSQGSSPLARGLPPPAGASDPWSRDHPRSRGVYPVRGSARDHDAGSSPLARGLPQARALEARRPRIIPARAGFTEAEDMWESYWSDHPRSRGVYPYSDATPVVVTGSSPLARGLPPGHPQRAGHPGIIPARAGFTL